MVAPVTGSLKSAVAVGLWATPVPVGEAATTTGAAVSLAAPAGATVVNWTSTQKFAPLPDVVGKDPEVPVSPLPTEAVLAGTVRAPVVFARVKYDAVCD